MELTTAHLFVLLLLSLVLCSFFGGACDFGNGLSLEGFHNDSPYRYSDYTTTDDAVSKYKYKKRTNGIRANQILRGNEDLYILKSEVVPPVCPACPAPKCNNNNNNNNNNNHNNHNNNNTAGSDSKCPPCPPCARCPEPAFECKKVPNYGRTNDDTMPYPVLNSFSQFGL
jgi:hypothetical protein